MANKKTATRRVRPTAGAPQRIRTRFTAVAAGAYVYVLDRNAGDGTWHIIIRDRVTAPTAHAAADRIADLMEIDAAAAPTMLRVQVWTCPTVLTGAILDVLVTTEPDAVRQTGAPREPK